MDLKKKQAIDYLTHLGYFISFDNLKLFHGRAREKGGFSTWSVDLGFHDNQSLFEGEKVGTLNLAEYNIAEQYGDYYAQQTGGIPEVHRVVAYQPNCLFFNKSFNFDGLTQTEKDNIKKALNELANEEVSELYPIKFEYRKKYIKTLNTIEEYLKNQKKRFISFDDIDNLCGETNKLQEELVLQIAGTINARELMKSNMFTCFKAFLTNSSKIKDKNNKKYPIEWNAVANWLSKYKVIGVKERVKSAPLNRVIETYNVFDEDKVNTLRIVNRAKGQGEGLYSELLAELQNYTDNFVVSFNFKNWNPEEIMAYIKTNPKLKKLYNLSAGLWEGFTIGEHTETTLRVFEDSFSNEVSDQIKPIMILALLSHDLGKGVYVKDGGNCEELTSKYCKELCSMLGVSDQATQIVEYLVCESQKYTTEYFIRKNPQAMENFKLRTGEKLQEIFNNRVSIRMIKAVCSMGVMLQTCDSGAYTRYGITRDQDDNFKYFNGDDRFTMSMEKPTDMRGKKQRLVSPELGDF